MESSGLVDVVATAAGAGDLHACVHVDCTVTTGSYVTVLLPDTMTKVNIEEFL